MPYAVKNTGFIFGLVLIVFLAGLVDYTVILLIINGRLSSQSTYQGIKANRVGQALLWKKRILDSVVLSIRHVEIANRGYGGMCAYTVIMGSSIPAIFRAILPEGSFLYDLLSSRSFVILLCTLGVSLPLSLYRDLSALAKTSAASVIMIVFVVFSVAVVGRTVPIELRGDPMERWTFFNTGIFQGIGVISFGLTI